MKLTVLILVGLAILAALYWGVVKILKGVGK